MKFQLDFTIELPEERLNFIKSLDLSSLTKKELELCANYILYGRNEDGSSIIKDGKVYIKPKYNSYTKEAPASIEEMMESPTFDETVFTKPKNIYKKPKLQIDRDKCKDVPGMQQLWEEIEHIEQKLQDDKDKYSSKQIYQMQHQLIEMRRQQYLLQEIAFPPMQLNKNRGSQYRDPTLEQMEYPVFPCGTAAKKDDPDFIYPLNSKRHFEGNVEQRIEDYQRLGKPYFNFLDKEHIYQLCLHYYDIKKYAEKFPDSPLMGLIYTLDFYIEKAKLSEQQKLIVEGKKLRLLNKDICRILMDQMGIYHQENYISTIWNKVCQMIADAADLHLDEWCCKDYLKAWKKCNCCGQFYLRDPRNFVRKTKSADGLTNRCKNCDKKKRRGEA